MAHDKRHSVSVIAASAVSAKRLVSYSAMHATSPALVRGVSEYAAAAGRGVSLITAYSAEVEAAEAISPGSYVRPSLDGTGRAINGDQYASCGIALSSAAAAGDLLEVRLVENVLAGALTASVPVSTVWANRGALVSAGQYTALFTDVGVGGGSVWIYSGGRWRPYSGRVILKNTLSNPNNATTSKVVLDYATLLPGLVQDGDILETTFLKERTGGTSDTDETDLGIGASAATFGTSTGYTTSLLAGAQITLGPRWALRRESATSIRRTGVVLSGSYGVSGSANTPVTVPSLDATSYLQITSKLTTGAGEVSYLRSYVVELLAGA